MEFDEDLSTTVTSEGGVGENSISFPPAPNPSAAKVKVPRVKKEKKDPGESPLMVCYGDASPACFCSHTTEISTASRVSLRYNCLVYSVLPATPRARKTPGPKGSAKKAKKRNPWSDDDSKSDSDLEDRDSEPVVIPRDTKSQRASGEVGRGGQGMTRPVRAVRALPCSPGLCQLLSIKSLVGWAFDLSQK